MYHLKTGQRAHFLFLYSVVFGGSCISGGQSLTSQAWESVLSTKWDLGIITLGSKCLYPLSHIKLVLMYSFN